MRVNRSRIVVAAVLAVAAAGVIATSVAVASAGSGQPSVHGRGAGESAGSRHHGRAQFSWFRAGSTMVYLNVTPRQGDETLRDWAGFRVDHLRDDDARSALLERAVSSYTVT
jgi:hypothetical protein